MLSRFSRTQSINSSFGTEEQWRPSLNYRLLTWKPPVCKSEFTWSCSGFSRFSLWELALALDSSCFTTWRLCWCATALVNVSKTFSRIPSTSVVSSPYSNNSSISLVRNASWRASQRYSFTSLSLYLLGGTGWPLKLLKKQLTPITNGCAKFQVSFSR